MVTKEAGEKIENTTKKNVFYPSALQDETGVQTQMLDTISSVQPLSRI